LPVSFFHLYMVLGGFLSRVVWKLQFLNNFH
jgi:hypothetical protein